MKIKFTNYDDGIHHFEFLENADDLNLDERFFGKLKINCKMDKSQHQIVVDCDLNFVAKLTCDRCVSEFERTFPEHFQNIYFTNYENENADDPGIYYLAPNEDKIDLSSDVEEILKVSLPMKILCNEECKGLCSTCGQNLSESECNCKDNIENPIWVQLKKLKKNLN